MMTSDGIFMSIKTVNFKVLWVILVLSFSTFIYAAKDKTPQVNVVVVEMRLLSPVAWVSGTVVSPNNSKIAAEVTGRLIEMAAIGSQVEEGDVIATLNPEQLSYLQKEHQANLESAQYKLKYLESEVVRKRSLAKRNLSAINDLDETIANRDVAVGNVSEAKAKLAQTTLNLSYTQIKAPFSGMVTRRLSNIGELINSGTAILQLVETKNLEAVATTTLESYPFIKNVSELAIKSSLGTGVAPIKTLVPVADARSHLMQVRLDMSKFDWPVGLGMRVAVSNGESKQVLAVPRDALILRRDGISLFRLNSNNEAEQIDVTTGIGAGDYIQISGAIHEGDKIIIRGAERLKSGDKVAVKSNNQTLISGGL